MTVVAERVLRPGLDRPGIRERLRRRGIVEIPAALDPALAERTRRFLARGMPQRWWSAAVRAGGDPEYFPDTAEAADRIGAAHRRARAAMRKGQFAYSFRRTLDDHADDCVCPECDLRRALRSPEVADFFTAVGVGGTVPGEMFASRYQPGSFLSPHHDQGNGRVAFVLNLTARWAPQWGGLLMFLGDDWHTVRRVCTPTFNTLCLFLLPPDRPVPHLVTEVVAHRRLAFTGWYGTGGGS